MPRFMLHFVFALFTAVALSGAWMRLFPFQNHAPIPYTNILHGHSHLAILGWSFLGVFLVFLAIEWSSFRSKTHAKILSAIIFVVSALMFAAFLYQGYAVFSIILSTLHIFVEYWATIFIYRHLKSVNKLPVIGTLYLKGSLIALVISSIGPFSLGFIAANGLRHSDWFDMAIYFYLHFQYNGWLYLALIGLFMFILYRKGIRMNSGLMRSGFWLYFISLFPGYFLSILWVDLGTFSRILATFGSIGQWVGVLCVLLAVGNIWRHVRRHVAKIISVCLAVTFVLLFFKSTMELGLIWPPLAELVYDTRNIIIGYLHFTLLGFVSIFILAQFLMTGLLDTLREATSFGLIVFLIGFILNELLLFLMGFFQWINAPAIPFAVHGLLAAALFLLAGILILWFASIREKHVA